VSYLNGYTVKLRAWDEEHDITQYVVSFTTESVAGLGQLGSARCAITLNNQTGAFTPYEVGGQGTYSNDNLFGYCLTIEAEIDDTPSPIDVTVFDGVIRNVAMSGNVYNSTVTLTCTDWVAVSSGVPANTVQGSTAYDFDDTLEYVMNGSFSPTTFGLGLDLPTFGATSPAESFQAIPMGPVSTQLKMPATSSTTAHDLLANTVLTSGPFVTWPGEIIFTVSPAQIQYNLYTLDRTLTRTFSVTAMQFGPDLSGNGIPIVDITIGYNTELITSQTSTTSGLSGSTEQTVTNNTTTATYGGRTRTYSGTANTSDSEALQVSGFWTNRQAIARSTPLEVTTTLAAIDADQTAVPAQVAALFDFGDSLYQVASTSFTATGGVYITTDQITTRRTISATPSNTTITVSMIPAADYQSFVLDSSTLGVLNQNRLG
jgi:hypothetical protein